LDKKLVTFYAQQDLFTPCLHFLYDLAMKQTKSISQLHYGKK